MKIEFTVQAITGACEFSKYSYFLLDQNTDANSLKQYKTELSKINKNRTAHTKN